MKVGECTSSSHSPFENGRQNVILSEMFLVTVFQLLSQTASITVQGNLHPLIIKSSHMQSMFYNIWSNTVYIHNC